MDRDTFHNVVKTALIIEKWCITHNFLEIKVGGVDMRIDPLAVPVLIFNSFFQHRKLYNG